MIKNLKIIFFIMIFAAFVFGQDSQNTKNPKIVSVDTEAFYIEDSGIPELIKIQKQLEIEFKDKNKELKDLERKLKELTDEIEKATKTANILGCDYPFEKKIEIAKKMDSDIVQKRNELRDSYLQRRDELSKDVNKKMLEAFRIFAKENNYPLILDSSKENSSVIIDGEIIDVTKEFIQFYNERFGDEKSQ